MHNIIYVRWKCKATQYSIFANANFIKNFKKRYKGPSPFNVVAFYVQIRNHNHFLFQQENLRSVLGIFQNFIYLLNNSNNKLFFLTFHIIKSLILAAPYRQLNAFYFIFVTLSMVCCHIEKVAGLAGGLTNCQVHDS